MRDLSDGFICLTPFLPADAPILCDGDNDPELRRRFEIPAEFIPSLRHSHGVIARWQDERAAGTRFAFAVRNATSRELLGGVELQPREAQIGNLSYWTYPAHRERRVATRAVALACALAIEDLGLHWLGVAHGCGQPTLSNSRCSQWLHRMWRSRRSDPARSRTHTIIGGCRTGLILRPDRRITRRCS